MFIGQQFLQNVLGYSTIDAGLAILPAPVFTHLASRPTSLHAWRCPCIDIRHRPPACSALVRIAHRCAELLITHAEPPIGAAMGSVLIKT
jgi:hypothetical protein